MPFKSLAQRVHAEVVSSIQGQADISLVEREISKVLSQYLTNKKLELSKSALEQWLTLKVCLLWNEEYKRENFDPEFFRANIRELKADIANYEKTTLNLFLRKKTVIP